MKCYISHSAPHLTLSPILHILDILDISDTNSNKKVMTITKASSYPMFQPISLIKKMEFNYILTHKGLDSDIHEDSA